MVSWSLYLHFVHGAVLAQHHGGDTDGTKKLGHCQPMRGAEVSAEDIFLTVEYRTCRKPFGNRGTALAITPALGSGKAA